MNVFVLDLDPQKCAEYHCNKHLVKMITEHNQILGSIAYTARGINRKKEITPQFVNFHFQGFPRKHADGSPNPYGIGYVNHPCTKWAAASEFNYDWLCRLNILMCKEYTLRYKKVHAGQAITEWYMKNFPVNVPAVPMTKFPQAMPEDCKNEDTVTAYRNYYIKHKAQFAKWPADRVPHWWPNPTENETKTV